MFLYLTLSEFPNALQRTVMMVCPIFVGMAVSTYELRGLEVNILKIYLKRGCIIFFISILIYTGAIGGTLPETSGLAPQAMSACLLATLFVAIYAVEKDRSALYYWFALAAVPVIGLTRMGIAATLMTFPASLAPIKLKTRILALLVIVFVGTGIFYTERVQRKMFYTGFGDLGDVSFENPNFYTTGRAYLWDLMTEEMKRSPWFGFGANANERFIQSRVGFSGQPHNDFLRIRFDYGYVGLGLFLFCAFCQSLHAWIQARRNEGLAKILFYAGASSFIPLLMFMYTDNIVLYCQFFENLQFTILGLAYAASKKVNAEDIEQPKYPTKALQGSHLAARIRQKY